MRKKTDLAHPAQEVDDINKEKEGPSINWLAVAATSISATAVTLTLLGYGVSFAVEAEFGIPHASVFESALDLTDLAGYAIIQLLNHTTETLFDSKLYSSLYLRSWPQLLVGVVVALSAAGLAQYWARNAKSPKNLPPPKKPAPLPGAPHVRLRNGMLGVALGVSLMPFINAIIVMAICALCTLVALAPVLGMVAGRSYIKEWVVHPANCSVASNQATRSELENQVPSGEPPQKVATCVIVTKDANELGRGRVAVMTTKSAVLFDPATGEVRRIPISTNVVQIVSTLDAHPTRPATQASTPPLASQSASASSAGAIASPSASATVHSHKDASSRKHG